MVKVGTILTGMGQRKCDDLLFIIVSISEDEGYALMMGIGYNMLLAICVDKIKYNCFKIEDAHTGDMGDFFIGGSGGSAKREKNEKRFIKEEL
tara:strand:+ start:17205 stop:17483 length:279 start_codon:yes stop_codon:yes gene_type:complete